MDNTTKDEIKKQIKEKEEEFIQFSEKSQKEINQRAQLIQKSQNELQELVKSLQSQIDKRAGALESLKSLVTPVKKNGSTDGRKKE